MKKITATLVVTILIMVGAGYAFDPPRIIGVLTAREGRNGFAGDMCPLIVPNGPDKLVINEYEFNNEFPNRAYLWDGNDTMLDEPTFTFTSYEDQQVLGRHVVFFGSVRGSNHPALFGMVNQIRYEYLRIDIYESVAEPVNRPIQTLSIGVTGNSPSMEGGYFTRTLDFNGDGYYDIPTIHYHNNTVDELNIYFGNEELDTIPDWSIHRLVFDLSGGLDINGDGFDDLLILHNIDEILYFSLYLGGNPPDTIPVMNVRLRDYNLTDRFTMLPDINGDGYDEWGAYWFRANPVMDEGFLTFMGSAEPDSIPDLRLKGTPDRWPGRGTLVGGDFNGDEFGDIVTITSHRERGESEEMMIYFGNRWIDDGEGERDPDIFFDLINYQNGRFDLSQGALGAVADYNNDGIEDFCHMKYNDKVIVFTGSQDWRLSAPKDISKPNEFGILFDIHPNPLNSTVTISYSTGRNAYPPRLAIYDLSGRLVKELLSGEGTRQHPMESGRMPDLRAGGGSNTVGSTYPTVEVARWDASNQPAGVYVVRLEAGREVVSKKVVLIR